MALEPSPWTRRLCVLTAICSVVFTIGTTLQNFVIVNLDTLEHVMRLAGDTPANAQGFLTVFRIVGCLYIVGNALGILAVRGRTWVFWLVIVVNVTQAAGVRMVPPQMWEAAVDRYGWAGVLPSAVTDGGAALLALVLLGFFVKYRTPWAKHRSGIEKQPVRSHS